MLGGHGFQAGVGDHLPGGGPAGDRGEHAHGVAEAEAEAAVGGVHEGVGAGLHLGDGVVGGAHIVVAGGRGADDLHGQAVGPHPPGAVREPLQALAGPGLALVGVLQGDDVALVAHEAGEAQVLGALGGAAQLQGLVGAGQDAAAVVADVDLHQDPRRDAGGAGGGVEIGEVVGVVDGGHDVAAAGQGHEALHLAAAHDLVGHEHVVDAGVGHDLGLADLGAGDADGAGLQLHVGDGRGLVRLGVGPQVLARGLEVAGELPDVELQVVEVDQQGGGVDLGDGHADVLAGAHHSSRSFLSSKVMSAGPSSTDRSARASTSLP